MVFFCLCVGLAHALPNSILGVLGVSNSPLDDEDLTEEFLAGAGWSDDGGLPGRWVPGVATDYSEESYLMARPKIFGVETILVKATRRGEELEELQVTFADAGSFFGYYQQEKVPKNLSRKEAIAEMQRLMTIRQTEFKELYQDRLEKLEKELKKRSGKARGAQRGRTRALRAEMTEFQIDDRTVRLLSAPDRLLRLSIRKKGKIPGSWLDQSAEKVSTSERLRGLAQKSPAERKRRRHSKRGAHCSAGLPALLRVEYPHHGGPVFGAQPRRRLARGCGKISEHRLGCWVGYDGDLQSGGQGGRILDGPVTRLQSRHGATFSASRNAGDRVATLGTGSGSFAYANLARCRGRWGI